MSHFESRHHTLVCDECGTSPDLGGVHHPAVDDARTAAMEHRGWTTDGAELDWCDRCSGWARIKPHGFVPDSEFPTVCARCGFPGRAGRHDGGEG